MTQKDDIPYGSDVSTGVFKCADCGYIIKVQSVDSLPPCPMFKTTPHYINQWECLSGQGDAPEDPYPNSKLIGDLWHDLFKKK